MKRLHQFGGWQGAGGTNLRLQEHSQKWLRHFAWRSPFVSGLSLALALLVSSGVSQARQKPNEHPNRPPAAERKVQPAPRRNDRPPVVSRDDNRSGNRPASGSANRPGNNPAPDPNRNNAERFNPNRPPRTVGPPPNVQERWRNMTPQEKQRLSQNEERLRRLPPAQQQMLRERAQVWQRMTPQQRDHVRNDVLPKWRGMAPDRRQAIQQRLRVLQNMPESARNRRLSDPNFTRGMSDEDRSTLRDLSHLHVGGGPEPPGE
jgi:Protein of unknown function (DUF3106)